MNQIKIVRFIAERRKMVNLTQSQLAEKLDITDRAVSKWETGRAMPDTAIMLELCALLKITVNDLLTGEITSMENNVQNEKLLLDMAKVIEKKNKTTWIAMWIILAVSIIAFIGSALLVALFMPEGTWQIIAIILVCVVFLPPCFFALKLEISVGAYKCKKCGACMRIGCPAMTKGADGIVKIDDTMCNGCGLCTSYCKFGAILKEER